MSENYVGSSRVIGIGIEAERGAGADPQFFIKADSCDFATKVEKETKQKMIGSIQQGVTSNVVKKFGEGAVEFDVDDNSIGSFLVGVFGQSPVTTGSTNKTHTFAVKESNSHQSLALLDQDPNVSNQYPLTMINTFEINSDQNASVKCKIDARSKAGVDGTPVVASYTNIGNTFLHSDATIKVATNKAGLGAAVALDCLGITLTIEKNIKSRPFLGSIDEKDIANGVMGVKGSFIIDYTDQTFRDYMINGDEKAIEIKFATGANNSLTFVIPRAQLMWSPDSPLDDIVTQSIEFEGLKLAGSDLIECVLCNQFLGYEADSSSS